MSDISKSALGEQFDDGFEARIAACTTGQEIAALMHERAVSAGLVQRDIYDPNVLIPVEQPVPTALAKVVRVNGVVHTIEGKNETELAQNEAKLFRAIFEGRVDEDGDILLEQEQSTPARRDAATGRFVAEQHDDADAQALEAARQAELELKFKRGELNTSDYLEQSGAIERVLAAKGIDVSLLQTASAVKIEEDFENDWASAVESFRERHPDWIGGEENKNLLGSLIAENNLNEADDKLQALEDVYAFAVQNNLLVETLESKIAAANDPTTLRQILQNPERQEQVRRGLDSARASDLFGR